MRSAQRRIALYVKRLVRDPARSGRRVELSWSRSACRRLKTTRRHRPPGPSGPLTSQQQAESEAIGSLVRPTGAQAVTADSGSVGLVAVRLAAAGAAPSRSVWATLGPSVHPCGSRGGWLGSDRDGLCRVRRPVRSAAGQPVSRRRCGATPPRTWTLSGH